MTLTEFLLARIAEDEAAAKAVVAEHALWDWESYVAGAGMYDQPAGVFASSHGPDRVLIECEVKRRIVELHEPWAAVTSKERTYFECNICFLEWEREEAPRFQPWPCPTLRALTLPFADHLEYDETWRP